ncbi:hypothetical protein RQP46_002977 [Phenoliferia psychrophenolica]
MRNDWRAKSLAAALVLSTSVLAYDQPHFKSPAGHAHADCLHSSSVTQINHLLRTGGAGTNIILCPHAQIAIDPHGYPILFTAPRQSIYTVGSPEDSSRATITISHPKGHYSGDLATAIKADCASCRGAVIRNIQVDGGRMELGGIEGGDALILIGGDDGEQEVRHIDAWGARGFAVIHAAEGKSGSCSGVVIADNNIHSSGDAPLDLMLNSELVRLRDGPPPYLGKERPGHWSDGISIACQQSSVSDNTLRDISGVGIAVRGSPGTQVIQNTIVARDRDMLVGISVVAHPIFSKKVKHGGVIVRENSIHAATAMIRIGISTGAGAWATDELVGDHEIAFGSEVVKNRLSSYTGYYGYAIAVSDSRGIVVNENAISASIWGFQTDSCYTRPVFALPAPLLRDSRSVIGQLQGEFRDLHFGFLLCVGPGSASSSHEVAQHQINEQYIEQKAVRTRQGRPAPLAIPRNQVAGGPLHPHKGGRAGVHAYAQPKAGAGRGAMGGAGPAVKKGRRADDEGPYHKAEPGLEAADPTGGVDSKRFQYKGTGKADVVLISSDDIRFEVHQLNLSAASIPFSEMFSIGTPDALPEIKLAEHSTVLEELLPYIYSRQITSKRTLFERLGQQVALATPPPANAGGAAARDGDLLMSGFAFAVHFGFARLAEQTAVAIVERMTFQEVLEEADSIGQDWIEIPREKAFLLLNYLGSRQTQVNSIDDRALLTLITTAARCEKRGTYSNSTACNLVPLWYERRQRTAPILIRQVISTDGAVCPTCLSTFSQSPMSRKVVNRSKGQYPIADVLAILHSPSALITLNPLVTAHSLLPTLEPAGASTTWSITDALKLFGVFPTTTTYTGTFTRSGARAMDVRCLAALGVVASGRWTVEDDGTVVEEGELEAPWWLIGYVSGQWEASHKVLMVRMEELLRAPGDGGPAGTGVLE